VKDVIGKNSKDIIVLNV